jgi:uncharacterized membrane protein
LLTSRGLLNLVIWVLTISYPFLVWFFLDSFEPRYFTLMLAGLILLRFLIQKSDRIWNLLFILCTLFLLIVSIINESGWLLAYPVFVSLLFFGVFAASLVFPPPIIERLARLEDPNLPVKGVIYTRKVTQVWCGFFLLNALISLYTIWHGELWLWSLYNGLVFYLLMGLLMLAEMAVRSRVKASY